MIAPEASGTVTVDIAARTEVALVETSEPPVYQWIARRAPRLRELELSDLIIAARLGTHRPGPASVMPGDADADVVERQAADAGG